MKNKIAVVILSIIVIILVGSCILFYISSTVSVAIKPLVSGVARSIVIQKSIQGYLKTNLSGGDVDSEINELKSINQQLSIIEARLNNIESRLSITSPLK